MSAAYAGGAAIDIVDSGNANAATINTLANGKLDEATLATWITAHGTASIKKIYDQTGGAKHLAQATVANMPTIIQSALGSLSCMSFVRASSQQLSVTSNYTISQPMTYSVVANRTGSTSSQMCLLGNSNSQSEILFTTAATIDIYSTPGGGGVGMSPFTGGVADATWLAVNALLNGASSSAYVNGTNNGSLGAGTVAVSPTNVTSMGDDLSGNFLDGRMTEAGLWAADKSSNFVALNSNQRTYWGF
jgi:hypothetical protein